MPRPLPPSIDQEIIERFIYGDTTTKIEKDLNISHGAVMDRVYSVEQKLGKRQVDAMRMVTVALKKNKIRVEMVVFAARIALKLRQTGIDYELFDDFVSSVYQECQNYHIDADQLVEYSSSLLKLQKALDCPVHEVLSRVQLLVAKFNELNKSIRDLKEEEKGEENRLQATLSKTKVTETTLKHFKDIEGRLKKRDIDLAQVDKVCNMVENAEEAGYDVALMIRRSKEVDSLQKSSQTLIAQNQKLEQKNSSLEKEIASNQKILDGHKLLLSEVQLLKKLGLGVVDLGRLKSKIKEIAEKRRINPEEAFRAFLKDLDQYDEVQGYKILLEEHKSEETRLKQRIAQITDKIKQIEMLYDKKKKVRDALSHLLDKGVEEWQILQTKRVLESSGMSIEELNEQLKKQGSLKHKIESTNTELQKLEKRIAELKAELQQLELSKAEMQSTVRLLNAQVVSKLDGVKPKVDKVIDDLDKSIHTNLSKLTKTLDSTSETTKEKIGNIFDDLKAKVEQTSQTAVKTVDDSTKEILDTAKFSIKESAREIVSKEEEALSRLTDQASKSVDDSKQTAEHSIEELSQVAKNATKSIGRIKALEPLATLLHEGTGTKEEVNPPMITLLMRFESWYPSDQTVQRRTKDLIQAILEDMGMEGELDPFL